ncbi:MAG: discoidin domain-containing protein, partial [Actinomadura rubrobrunea]|nr:discoidin domain-containing protein [Actinomadura rubrobrunea]
LLSQGRPATASSVEDGAYPASAAVDGDTGTRWSSAAGDPQWLQVDLGGTAEISRVVLRWEAAYGKAFKIQVSADGSAWADVYSTTSGTGGTQTLDVSGTGRYVRMYGTARGTGYGYSLWEFQVYGEMSGAACGTANAALNQPATASSVESDAYPASAAVDGDTGTRWSSQFSDPQWIQIDLGSTQSICKVVLTWEDAYATAFQLQVSTDGSSWTPIYSTSTGTGGTQTLDVSGTGRYLRVHGTARATGYGYSLWEIAVHTGDGAVPSQTPISAFKKVSASSWEGGNAPAAAVDGRTTTRWASLPGDDQWLKVDLGAAGTITALSLNWEAAYATGYRIEVSDDDSRWTTIYSTTTGKGGVENLAVSGRGRYVRFTGTARATGYGYSLWEFQVFGTLDTTADTPPLLSRPTKAPSDTGRFALQAPADRAMVTDTRRPELSWSAVPGTAR